MADKNAKKSSSNTPTTQYVAEKHAKRSISNTPTTQCVADKHPKKSSSSTPTPQYLANKHAKRNISNTPTTQHVADKHAKKSCSSSLNKEYDNMIYRLCLKYDLDDSKKKAIWDKIYGRNDTNAAKSSTSFQEPEPSTSTSNDPRMTVTSLFSDTEIQAMKETNSNSSNSNKETCSEIEKITKMRLEARNSIPIAATQHHRKMSITSFPFCEIEKYTHELNKTKSNNLHVDKSMQRYVLDLTCFVHDKKSSQHRHHHAKKTKNKSFERQNTIASNLPKTSKDIKINVSKKKPQ